MKKVAIVGCGLYMDSGYGCPGEWRCLKAAAIGDGEFEEPSQAICHLKCQCPSRSTVPNVGMEIKPDVIYLSSCLANAKLDCPYRSAEELATMLRGKTGIEVVLGTHDYH